MNCEEQHDGEHRETGHGVAQNLVGPESCFKTLRRLFVTNAMPAKKCDM